MTSEDGFCVGFPMEPAVPGIANRSFLKKRLWDDRSDYGKINISS
jgi:hypothetical protein